MSGMGYGSSHIYIIYRYNIYMLLGVSGLLLLLSYTVYDLDSPHKGKPPPGTEVLNSSQQQPTANKMVQNATPTAPLLHALPRGIQEPECLPPAKCIGTSQRDSPKMLIKEGGHCLGNLVQKRHQQQRGGVRQW